MKHTELRQFLLEANRASLSPAEKDVFLYYQSRGRIWDCPDVKVAAEIGRSRNAVCEARNRLKLRQWIEEKTPFQIAVLKSFSVGTATEKDESPVGNATKPVEDATVRVGNATGESEKRLKVAVNATKEKDLQHPKRNIEEKEEKVSEQEAPATDIKTEYNAMDSEDLGYPYTSLFAAFPDLILTPAHLGLIEQDIKDTDVDREALRRTIAKYLGNRNGASYNPSRIGTFLGVFRDEKAKVTRNGSSQSHTNGHKPTPAEVIANRTYR